MIVYALVRDMQATTSLPDGIELAGYAIINDDGVTHPQPTAFFIALVLRSLSDVVSLVDDEAHDFAFNATKTAVLSAAVRDLWVTVQEIRLMSVSDRADISHQVSDSLEYFKLKEKSAALKSALINSVDSFSLRIGVLFIEAFHLADSLVRVGPPVGDGWARDIARYGVTADSSSRGDESPNSLPNLALLRRRIDEVKGSLFLHEKVDSHHLDSLLMSSLQGQMDRLEHGGDVWYEIKTTFCTDIPAVLRYVAWFPFEFTRDRSRLTAGLLSVCNPPISDRIKLAVKYLHSDHPKYKLAMEDSELAMGFNEQLYFNFSPLYWEFADSTNTTIRPRQFRAIGSLYRAPELLTALSTCGRLIGSGIRYGLPIGIQLSPAVLAMLQSPTARRGYDDLARRENEEFYHSATVTPTTLYDVSIMDRGDMFDQVARTLYERTVSSISAEVSLILVGIHQVLKPGTMDLLSPRELAELITSRTVS